MTLADNVILENTDFWSKMIKINQLAVKSDGLNLNYLIFNRLNQPF